MDNSRNANETEAELTNCPIDVDMEKLKRRFEDLNIVEDDGVGMPSLKKQKKEAEDLSRNSQWNNQVIEDLELHRLEKCSEDLIEEVKELADAGSFPKGITTYVGVKGGILPTPEFVAGATVGKTMEEIWNHLMDKNVGKIGVYGMGGIGKTTVMKHIHNRLVSEENDFDHVIWVTVSRNSDLRKLQSTISESMGLDLSGLEDAMLRAARIYEALQKKRCMLILDDVWEGFDLQDIGFPKPSIANGCKLLLTTRSLDVCRFMDCEPIRMEVLSDEEAWNLFLNHAGHDLLRVPNLKPIMREVIEKCARLPLAMTIVGESMRGKVDVRMWEKALKRLRPNPDDSQRDIISMLRISYDSLENQRLQYCLLYCALYPEAYKIKIEELISRLIEEGIIEESNIRLQQFDEGQAMLNSLVHVSLLSGVTSYGRKCVRMHDLIRDMALQITSESPRFLVQAGLRLEQLPEMWSTSPVKVSFMRNQILEMPLSASSLSPQVSTLLLNDNPLKSIPCSFFDNLRGLQVLNLSNTGIQVLPDSISDLVKLVALLLSNCINLEGVPSLARLTRLRSLDLGNTWVGSVPHGLEKLVNLRYLNLDRCSSTFPDDVLPKLCSLQHLIIKGKVKTDELVKLKRLEIFEGKLSVDDFIAYMRHRDSGGGPTNYNIQVVPASEVTVYAGINFAIAAMPKYQLFFVSIANCSISKGRRGKDPFLFPKDVQNLELSNCNDAVSLCQVPSFETITNLREIKIQGCNRMTHLFSTASTPTSALQSIESLDIGVMQNLRELILEEAVASTLFTQAAFSSLRSFRISGCPLIRELFPVEILSSLQNLVNLEVDYCQNLEEVIKTSPCDSPKYLTLPRLRRLVLSQLRRLKNICSLSSFLVCDSLRWITVGGCSMVRRMPLHMPLDHEGNPSPPPSLQRIGISRQDWNSLVWDHDKSKNVLQRFCQFRDTGETRKRQLEVGDNDILFGAPKSVRRD